MYSASGRPVQGSPLPKKDVRPYNMAGTFGWINDSDWSKIKEAIGARPEVKVVFTADGRYAIWPSNMNENCNNFWNNSSLSPSAWSGYTAWSTLG